jgi:hypothetical protein
MRQNPTLRLRHGLEAKTGLPAMALS